MERAQQHSGSSADVNSLIEQLLERFDAEGQAALDDLCAKHPSLAETLRRRVAILRDAGMFTAPLEVKVPDKLGEYRLVRPLGGGGMGVVYLAVQEALGREVALKIVRPEHLYFPGTRERFRREVETIARLHHPGIVPIYSVGEEQGIPYFAMQRVLGRTLEDVLQLQRGRAPAELEGHDFAPETSRDDYLFRGTWEHVCLRVVRQVAEALDHAHQQGVLHRDLKPSNVMVTSDGASRALLFDFGLASMEGSERLTRSGAQLGTLHYMSPEQANGSIDSMTARSDVYSLGVVLYELLTLQRPFEGKSDAAVVVAIQEGRRRPVRELNPTITWDAETVCLTALELDPARRYATAADFARDLGNVLDHHPIEARRASLPLRARRWARRHPALTVSLALFVALAIAAAALFEVQQRRAAGLLLAQRDRAEKNLGRALEAVDRMLMRVSDVDLRFVPQMESVRRSLLEDAVALLRGFLSDNADDPRVRLQVVLAQERLSELLSELGRSDEAIAHVRDALAILGADSIVDGESLTREQRDEMLVEAHIKLARTLASGGAAAEARREYDALGKLLDQRLAREPNSVRVRSWIANTGAATGALLRDAGEIDEARGRFEVAIATGEQLVDELPDDMTLRGSLAASLDEYGLMLLQHFTRADGNNPEAEQAFTRAVELGEQIVALPHEPRDEYVLATVRANLAGVLRRRGDFEGARVLYEKSRGELEELTRKFPDTMANEFELATCLNQLGLLADTQEHNADAEQLYAAGLAHLDALALRVPRQHGILNRIGTAELNVGAMAIQRGSPKEALPHFERALEMQRAAVELAPEQALYPDDLATSYRALHDARFQLGDHRGAADAIEGLTRVRPDRWQDRTRAAAGLARCVTLARDNAALADTERASLVRDYSTRAVAQLRAALERGMPDPSELKTVDVLDPLRDTEAFQQLLREIK